jgi:hypothetical protein
MRNQCYECKKDFISMRAFDAHRIGEIAIIVKRGRRKLYLRNPERRCMSTREMKAAGFKKNDEEMWNNR